MQSDSGTLRTSDRLRVPTVRLSATGPTGRRLSHAAGANIWNNLPMVVTTSPFLYSFKKRLKTYLFKLTYPDIAF
jgi:hypothetical protein